MKTILAILAAVALTGCATKLSIPAEESFTPKPKFQGVKITWVSSEKPAEECKRLFPSYGGFHPHTVACAGWNHQSTPKTCTIVTGKDTTSQVLGHEIRHCFEGSFHD